MRNNDTDEINWQRGREGKERGREGQKRQKRKIEGERVRERESERDNEGHEGRVHACMHAHMATLTHVHIHMQTDKAFRR